MNPHSEHRKTVRLRDRLREATAGAILDAAERAFAEHGPRARMETIAENAGIAVGTLYNHFADRDALWAEVCRSRREALLVRLEEALEGARGQPFPAALRAFLAAFFTHWQSHRGFLAVLVQSEPLAARSPRAAGQGRTMAQELLAHAVRLVRRGVADGTLRPDVAELCPTFLLGLVRSVLFEDLGRAPAPEEAATRLDRMVELFLRGAGQKA